MRNVSWQARSIIADCTALGLPPATAGGGAAGADGDSREAARGHVCRMFTPLPQRLKSVRFAGANLIEAPAVARVIAATEERLNGTGRLLIRESGTEPVIRVMAEAEDESLLTLAVDEVCAAIAAMAQGAGALTTDQTGRAASSCPERSRSTGSRRPT
jgi:hypothetical protein